MRLSFLKLEQKLIFRESRSFTHSGADSDTLYNLMAESTIKINFKTIGSPEFSIDIAPSATVLDVKTACVDKAGVPVE
jgi:hypothetical protein